VVTTPVPVGTLPIALVGDRVVVASKQGYDYWDPSQLIFKPTWNGTVREVFGQYGDLAVATVDTGPSGSDRKPGGCLALLSLAGDGLHDTRQTCQPIALSGQLPNVLSPTGRWLAIANGPRAQIVDLSTVFDRPSGPSCVFQSSVEGMAWEDDGHLVVRTSSGWRRCTSDAVVTPVDTTARAADSWTLVSRSG
jgi:hypothetical protein